MKMYIVSATWQIFGAKKRNRQTAIILAESKEEATEKFKMNVNVPEEAIIEAYEEKDGVYVLTQKMI